jgi:glycosyltransferase involved in cell wall biosynthesis
LRIALVADPYVAVPPKKYGGSEQVIYYLIKGLIEAGHEPILFGPGDSEVPCELVPTVPKAIPFPERKADTLKFQKKITAVAQTMQALLHKNMGNFDIIHSHASVSTGFDLRKFSHVPNLTTIHNTIKFSDIPYYETRKQLNYATISRNQQEAFPTLSYAGVVYNGEDPSEFPIVESPEDYLCFLGRFDRDKNPHLAIQLAIAVGMRIKIAGKVDFSGDGYFQDKVEPYLGHPLVEYLGELDFAQKVDLLAHASCNLHPIGFREGFGLTVMEAAYCGTPTLAINRGSMPELIEDGRTGILVEDFIEGCHALQGNFEMDRIYIAKRARTLFNYKIMAKQYIRVYEDLLSNYRTKRKPLPQVPYSKQR